MDQTCGVASAPQLGQGGRNKWTDSSEIEQNKSYRLLRVSQYFGEVDSAVLCLSTNASNSKTLPDIYAM